MFALRCGLALFSEYLVPLQVGALLIPDPFKGSVLPDHLIRGGRALLLEQLDPLLAHLILAVLSMLLLLLL